MRGCLLAVSVLISMMVWAETAPAPPTVPQSLEEAKAQRERAASMRDQAERQHKADQERCYSKFLLNDCLATAKQRYTETIIAARKLDQPARDFEREARRQEVAAKEAQRADELPRREAEQKEQGERYRAEQAAKAAERERRLLEKARKAEQGRQKRAADQARRQEKLDKRAQQDAERAAKKASSEPVKDTAGGVH